MKGGWEEKETEGRRKGGGRWKFTLKCSSSFKSPSMNLPEGNLSSFIFILSCLSSPLMQLLWIPPHPPQKKKSLSQQRQRFADERKTFCSLPAHITIPLCVSTHQNGLNTVVMGLTPTFLSFPALSRTSNSSCLLILLFFCPAAGGKSVFLAAHDFRLPGVRVRRASRF